MRFKKIKLNRFTKILLSIAVLVMVGYLLFVCVGGVDFAQAQAAKVTTKDSSNDGSAEGIARFLTWILMGLVKLVGTLFSLVLSLFISVTQFDKFTDSRAVEIGWTLIRDMANIFFVLIMLVIAFGTLFKVQTYEYKQLLPKLVIAIILVNFSKMIVGIAIDFGQVIMMTFVNVFKDIAAGSITSAMGLEAMLKLRDLMNDSGMDEAINDWDIFTAVALALVALTVMLIVMLSLTIMLVFRIIMLWMLIVLSPLAFVASAMPTGPLQSVSFIGQFWSQLSKYIIIGPVMAFFLWLSFSIMQGSGASSEQNLMALNKDIKMEGTQSGSPSGSTASRMQFMASEFSSTQYIVDYMVVVALLVGSLMAAQQMGVMGGAMGMNAVNKMKGMAQKGLKGASVWGGRKLDKWSIAAQSKAKIARPISLRPSIIKEAYQAAVKRKEEKFYKEKGVAGGMQDIFNKTLSFGKDKTNKQLQERMGAVAAKGKERDEMPGGNDEMVIVNSLNKSTGKDGKSLNAVKDESDIYQLAKTHGLNSLVEGGKGEDILEKLVQMFGEKEGVRIMYNVESYGLNNNDPQWKAQTEVNQETGEIERTRLRKEDFDVGPNAANPEMAKNLIKKFNYKQASGDQAFQNLTIDDLFTDKGAAANQKMLGSKKAYIQADYHGRKKGRALVQDISRDAFHVQDGNLDEAAQEQVLKTASQFATDYGYAQQQLKSHFSSKDNGFLEALKKFADNEQVVDEQQKRSIYRMMGKIVNPEGKGEEFMKNGNIVDNKKADGIIKKWKNGGSFEQSEADDHASAAANKRQEITRNEETIKKNAQKRQEILAKSTTTEEEKQIFHEKGKENETLTEKNKKIDNEIKTIHEPATVAEERADDLSADELGDKNNKNKVNILSKKLAAEITRALGGLDAGGTVDFSKLEAILKDFGDHVNKNIASGPKLDLNYGQKNNMEKIADIDNKKGVLNSLKKIAERIGKKSEQA